MIWKIQKGKISRKFDLKQNKTKSSKQQKKLPSFPCSEGVGRNMWPALFQRSLRQNFKTQLLIFWPQLLIFDTYSPPPPSFQSALCVPHGSGDEAGVWFTRERAQTFHPGQQDCQIQVQTDGKVMKGDAWRRRRMFLEGVRLLERQRWWLQKSERLKESF